MLVFTIAEANNYDGAVMRFQFAPTRSWQAFSISGLPSRMAAMEDKPVTLAKAIQTWNVSVKRRSDALQTGTVSASLRKILDEARNARVAANRATPAPLF